MPTSSASSSSCGARASPPRTCARASARSPRSGPRGGAGGERRVKLVTWNVNSLAARLPRVLEFLEAERPDIACLQETKTADDAFPVAELREAGYEAVHHSAGRWAGVAILARAGLSLDDPSSGLPGELNADEARWIEATVGGLRVASVYVTNGRAVGTPTFDEKLAFLEAMAKRVGQIASGGEP